MPAVASPYCAAVYAAAAPWLEFVAASYDTAESTDAADAAARESIDKLERRGLISANAARLLLEAFDLLPLDMA